MSTHEHDKKSYSSCDSRFQSPPVRDPDPTVVRMPAWQRHTETSGGYEPYDRGNGVDNPYLGTRPVRKKLLRTRFHSARLSRRTSHRVSYQRSLYGRDGCRSGSDSTCDDQTPYGAQPIFTDSRDRSVAFPNPYSRRTLRFWRWFRAIPLALLTLAAVVAYGANIVAGVLPHHLFYPVYNADAIRESSERHGVDPYLVCAVIKSESGWNENAKSSAGAVGLMQLMPATAEEMATTKHVDPHAYPLSKLTVAHVNIEYGCAYLAYLQRCCRSRDEVIAAYNAGIGNVQQWRAKGGNFVSSIAYGETRAYLTRVTEFYAKYKEFHPDGIGKS